MKITISNRTEVEVCTLHVEAAVRYWEDSTINGEDDTEDGSKIPCKVGNLWKPIIDLETGQILNWAQDGRRAEIHYKVCDAGNYYIKDASGKIILSIEDDYVPEILCPAGRGYGDYIIMNIDEGGYIQNWKPDLTQFDEHDHQ